MTTSTMKENVNVLREKLSGGSIRFTTDYSIFKKHPQNREVQRDSAKFKHLLASVKEEDLLSSNPILVDKELYVFNGQHRLEEAKVLGKAIYYIVDTSLTARSMLLLNANQTNWKTNEYANHFSHAKEDSPEFKEYAELMAFCQTNGLSFRLAVEIVFSQKKPSSNKIMRSGRFTFPKGDDLVNMQRRLGDYRVIWNFFKEKNIKAPKYLHSETFKSGIVKFIKSNPPDLNTFLNRLEIKMRAFRACNSAVSYCEQFEEVYNFGAKHRVDFSKKEEKPNRRNFL